MYTGSVRKNEKGVVYNKKKNDDFVPEVTAEAQNVKSGKVYIFGNADVYEDEIDEVEMHEMRSRKSKGSKQHNKSSKHGKTRGRAIGSEAKTVLFERHIGSDSLAAISLQYGCPVAELKRINNLIRDQDFFALKVIQVPIRQDGHLLELIKNDPNAVSHELPKYDIDEFDNLNSRLKGNELHINYCNGVTGDDSENDFSDVETQNLFIRTMSISNDLHSKNNEPNDFLQSMDRDLEKIRKSVQIQKPSLEEVRLTLTNKTIQPLEPKKHGTACGLTLGHLMIFFLFVAVVLPLGYVIYKYS